MMKLAPILFGVGVAVAVGLLIVAGIYGWTRSNEIADIPCLGCLGLNPAPSGTSDFRFETVGDEEHDDVVLDLLKEQVVFLHFRIDVCPACDEIEPTIFDIEDEYTSVKFIHANLEHDYNEGDLELGTGTLRKIYDTYDIKFEVKGKAGGVPMMTIITLHEEGVVKPYFTTFYGSAYTREDITDMLDEALEYHKEYVDQF
jgi:thiol-disulfide isomerase/thioredoxin